MPVRHGKKALTYGISKSRTGISGLDEITRGGLPTGRPTLICGSAGCGKTVLGLEFLIRGATQLSDPRHPYPGSPPPRSHPQTDRYLSEHERILVRLDLQIEGAGDASVQ